MSVYRIHCYKNNAFVKCIILQFNIRKYIIRSCIFLKINTVKLYAHVFWYTQFITVFIQWNDTIFEYTYQILFYWYHQWAGGPNWYCINYANILWRRVVQSELDVLSGGNWVRVFMSSCCDAISTHFNISLKSK